MPSDNLKDKLQEHSENLEDHLSVAPKRVEAYYLNRDSPDGFSDFEEPPDQQFIRRGATAVEFAFKYDRRNRFVELNTNWGKRDVVFSHIGVGLELLLQGVYMKTAPEDFISKLKDNDGETPGHTKAKTRVMSALPDTLSSDQKAQISLVIDIVRKQRNNTVHFGLHGFYQQGLKIAYYEVCAYLIEQFSDDQLDIVGAIDEYRKKIREGIVISGPPPQDPLPLTQ